MRDLYWAFWIANDGYVNEAIASVMQFKRIMPDINTCLVYVGNKEEIESNPFDSVLHTTPLYKIWYLNSVYATYYALSNTGEYSIYFDTDTYLVEPIYDLYRMLEHGIDFTASHAPGRITCRTVEKIPDSFPEFNIGVCGFHNITKVRDMVGEWYSQYAEHREIYGNNDQGSLREILWNRGDIRVAVLPPEYNCRFNFGVFLRYSVKVLHGRNPDMDKVIESINSNSEMRVWTPKNIG